jgi:hypothetical protein
MTQRCERHSATEHHDLLLRNLPDGVSAYDICTGLKKYHTFKITRNLQRLLDMNHSGELRVESVVKLWNLAEYQ